MSGHQAFMSFANYLKTALTGSGLTVLIEKGDTAATPYLLVQSGPSRVRGKWLNTQLCQAWLVTAKLTTEPAEVTHGKLMELVIAKTTDPGYLTLWNFSVTPKKAVGTFDVSVMDVTDDMSRDPQRIGKVITWQLRSVNKPA
jgi:hypothetical protein